jgi:hypothetical protein
MSWRDKIARFCGFDGDRASPHGIKPWPADNIDPIEELARIINEAQAQDAHDEGRFGDLARLDPNPSKPPFDRPPACGAHERAPPSRITAECRASRERRAAW